MVGTLAAARWAYRNAEGDAMLPRIPAIECADLLHWRGAERRRWAARRSAAAKGGGGGVGRSKMEARRELGKLGAARVPLWVWVEYRKLQLGSS